jgi:hypothetical protein
MSKARTLAAELLDRTGLVKEAGAVVYAAADRRTAG